MMPNAKAPQVEEGYTRIANELMEVMAGFGFTARQWSVLVALMRKTYGYQKKEDDISLSQIGKLCNLPKSHVSSTIKQLADMNVLHKSAGKYGTTLSINKDYAQWNKEGSANLPTFCDASTVTKTVTPAQSAVIVDFKTGQSVSESITPEVTKTVTEEAAEGLPNWERGVTKSVTVEVTKSVTTKENLPKENQQKKTPRARKAKTTLLDWLADCEAQGVRPIPEDDPIFNYADGLDMPHDFLRLAWVEFKRKYGASEKTYKDWRAHFRNAVQENWYGIWFEKDEQWHLSTRGKQIEKEMKARGKRK